MLIKNFLYFNIETMFLKNIFHIYEIFYFRILKFDGWLR